MLQSEECDFVQVCVSYWGNQVVPTNWTHV